MGVNISFHVEVIQANCFGHLVPEILRCVAYRRFSLSQNRAEPVVGAC